MIPTGMSVTDAAQRLGVGRPALSNLLNGKASLSPTMALRLEKAFGANRQQLLDLQAASDRDRRHDEDRAVGVRAYVPSFLAIKARQIDQWAANNIEARRLLAVLLRRLIHSTGHALRRVDFPGYDNAECPGWDGWLEADEATAWIPEGKSGWELGTGNDPHRKADGDYTARLAKVASAKERAKCTFVFVTPRNWPGKIEWARNKEASGDWKGVRALDASDLEQWLEESIAVQVWLGEKLAIPMDGVGTLDECWTRWAKASEPQMTPDIFEPSISAHRVKFKKWLEGPSDRPFVVAADSREEALAFLACLFRTQDVPAKSRDIGAVFESAQTLRALASSSSPLIPIVHGEDAERALGAIYRKRHCIVVRPRNTVHQKLDIALEPLSHEAFRKSLTAMGFELDRIERLARESGRSPTILRRRLSKIDAIGTPRWASDPKDARSLIPMTLIGAWHAASSADREVLRTLAGRSYEEIEESITTLLQLDDSPVWSVGQYRGVASKIDALFAICASVMQKDIDDLLDLVEYVLSESNPALELPEDQRWAAAIYDKVRHHSVALRSGVCETLALLSVHGNTLFQDRLGVDVDNCVSRLVRRLLTPLTIEKLLSNDLDLPCYAEAAPDEVLTLLEEDLGQAEPTLHGLLKSADTSVFGDCPRTGLLWALECLAWNPRNLLRVTALLAQLSGTRIDDNYVNKPINSLAAIFRSWMPQTAASLAERVNALEMLCRNSEFADIGWQICIEQLTAGSRFVRRSYRPRWRSDASGAGEPVTTEERCEFTRKALDLALAWPRHDGGMLGDLIERLDGMCDEDRSAVWELVDDWSRDEATDDKARAALRERIRRFALVGRGHRHGVKAETREKACEVYERLAPREPVIRHAWLFASQWVQESADEIEDDYLDMSKRDARIHKLRTEAMTEIWEAHGFDGAAALLGDSNAPGVIGQYAASRAKNHAAATEILRTCLSGKAGPDSRIDGFMAGFVEYLDERLRTAVLLAVAKDVTAEQGARLFRCAPFGNRTWRLLDGQPKELRDRYWREVHAWGWLRFTETERIEFVDRLLEAKRPRAALQASRPNWERIETSRLKRLLMDIANSSADRDVGILLHPDDIPKALAALDGRTGVTSDEMAGLEFAFIDELERSEHGIPNLERKIEESPDVFVQALLCVYKREDGGVGSPEWDAEDPGQRAAFAMFAHRLLERISRIPGTDADGMIQPESLRQWVAEVRRICAGHGRADIGDRLIGKLLSKAPVDESGVWPCLPICEAMETAASQHIANGFLIGTLNARGVSTRAVDEGGGQERELAAKYRGWAERLRAVGYLFVSTILDRIGDSYDEDAKRWDTDAKVKQRLNA